MEKNDGAIPSSVYSAIAERLGVPKDDIEFYQELLKPDMSGDTELRYTGPTDAAEFLHAVREPMRALDDATHFRIGRQLLEQYAMCCIYPKDAPELPFVWFISDCTPEQQVRALAAAMGIEVGDE